MLNAEGKLESKQSINDNGLAPGIRVVAPTPIKPGPSIALFNPFFSFARDVDLSAILIEIHCVRENNSGEAEQNRHRLPMDYDVAAKLQLHPEMYRDKTKLQLPLTGRLLVWDGHDFFAHHRRIPVDADTSRAAGIGGTNPNRYAPDLVKVNSQGDL